jgi:hypothetical protein
MSDSHSSDERRRILAEQIAQEEQRISEIHAELERRRALVSSFKEQLTAFQPKGDGPMALDEGATSTTTTLSSEEKVRLFRSLFRGREDVFARRWESRMTGKAGYSPACANEWDPVLCGKARGPESTRKANCLECCEHAFFRVTVRMLTYISMFASRKRRLLDSRSLSSRSWTMRAGSGRRC